MTYKHQIVTYTGDGNTGRAITGVGFKPDLVMLKAYNGGAALGSVFRTKAHTGTNCQIWGAAQLTSQGIESLDFDGFTVGSNNLANQLNVKYVALCVFEGTAHFFKTGTFVGTGGDNRDIVIETGWSPMFMFVKNQDGEPAIFRSISHSGDESSVLANQIVSADYVQGFNVDGFQVGTKAAVNESGKTIHWFAWRNHDNLLAPFFETGTYVGTGGNLTVSGLNFQPVWVLQKPQATAGIDATWRHTAHPANEGSSWGSSGNSSLGIKGFGIVGGGSFLVGLVASQSGKTHQFLTVALDAVDIDTTPIIVTDISPSVGLTRGQTLMTIIGEGFEPGVKVTFDINENEDATDIVRVSSTQITCRSPAHAAGFVSIVVTNPTLADNDFVQVIDTFEYIAPTLSPNVGGKVGGTEVTITGADFLPGQRVFFGLVEATQIQYVDARTLIVQSPPHVTGSFTVTIEEL